MESAVYLLIGFPGTGKYTVAKAMRERLLATGRDGRLVDNHSVNNRIFELVELPAEGPLPRIVWDRVDEVREAVLRTIEDLSPRTWWFIFTNYLVKGLDEAYVERIHRLADRRGAVLVPVVLSCAPDEVLRRVVRPDRRAHLKDTSVSRASQALAKHELVDPDLPQTLHLDVTSVPPYRAAVRILGHAEVTVQMARQSVAVERFFASLSQVDLAQPCTENQLTGHPPWNAKDHLAHLIFRERGFQDLLDRVVDGDSEPLRVRGRTQEERDAFVNQENERDVEMHRGDGVEHLVQVWSEVRAETLRRVGRLSEREWNLRLSLPDSAGQVSLSALLVAPVGHVDAHLDQIRRLLCPPADRTA